MHSRDGNSVEALKLATTATNEFPNFPEMWIIRIDFLLPRARKSINAGRRLDAMFQDQALPANQTRSKALWSRWFSWTEWQWRRERISTEQTLQRYLSAATRCGTFTSEYTFLKDQILIRFLDWAGRVPIDQLTSKQGIESQSEAESEDSTDEESEDNDNAENTEKSLVNGSAKSNTSTVNLDTVRAVARKIQLQTFPTLAFYSRCIDYERTLIDHLDGTVGAPAKQSTAYQAALKNIHLLYEAACHVNDNDPEPWIRYTEFLQESGQHQRLAELHWKTTKTIRDPDAKAQFESSYQSIIKS